MTTYRGYPLFNVAEPQTKGIVRARASHLSLCVEPLVAQRSILFRIQTELGEKEGYNQLSAESDYSSLQLISAQPDPSLSLSSKPDAQRHGEHEDEDDEHPPSSCLLSAASVYSQDSWHQNPVPAIPSSSPSPSSTPEPVPVRDLEPEPPAKVQQQQRQQQPSESPVVAPPPARESQIRARPTVPSQGSEEHRRYAMALSPSMDWERGAIASPSLVPLDLATRFIVDIKLLKKDSSGPAGHKSVVVQSFVPPFSNAKANNTSSKVFPTAGPSSNSPTTPTTADPFRAGGAASGSFFLFQPDPPDQSSKKLRKKSTHVHTRTLSESHTSSSSKSSSSASLRRALSRLTFAAAAPSRDRADLPPALRRTKSQLVSPPLTPTANAQLPALRFSPIHLKLQLPTIHSAVTPSTSDPFKRADSPLVLMTLGPAVASSMDGGVKKDSLKEGVSITPPLPPLPPTTAAAPPPPPTPLHRRTTLKKPAPDTVRRTDPPQLPPIPSAPLVPADELIKVNERPPPPPALPPLPPLASLPTLLPLFPSPPPLPSLSQQQHPHHSQHPQHPPPTRDRTVASVAPAPAASVGVAVLKRAPPPRLPLVSQAPQIQPKRVHRRYASSPAVLNFKAKDLRIPQQPGTPPPPLPDLKERLVELDRMGMQIQRSTVNVNGASVLRGGV